MQAASRGSPRERGRGDVRLLPLGVNLLFFAFVHFFDSRILVAHASVVVAGGPALGTEVCAGAVVAGRVAVAGGGFVRAATS